MGALVSLPTATKAIADGAPFVAVGDPVFYSPIGAAFDRSGPDAASLVAEIDAILATLRDDGFLAERSGVRFDGLDLSVAPGDGTIEPVPLGGPSAFTADTRLVDVFPTEFDGVPLNPLAMNGADLELLLVEGDDGIGRAYPSLLSLGGDTSTDIAGLALVSAPIVTPDGSAMLTAARMDGVGSAEIVDRPDAAAHQPVRRPPEPHGHHRRQVGHADQRWCVLAGRGGHVHLSQVGGGVVRGGRPALRGRGARDLAIAMTQRAGRTWRPASGR